jgi:hypothetical protein
MKKFAGYGPGWNRCECGQKLKRTQKGAWGPDMKYHPRLVMKYHLGGGNLVHLHGKYSQRSHDLVMRKKAEAAARATS